MKLTIGDYICGSGCAMLGTIAIVVIIVLLAAWKGGW